MNYCFPSRRSAVMSRRGIVATSQPLAAQAGISMLQKGGNAIDAAIATAAALNVVEPMSTGLGGDAFALIYLAKTRELKALNASGRAPYAATLETMRKLGHKTMPQVGIHSVTVPGTLDGWCTLLEAYGTMTLKEVLAPAIRLAEEGFPVTEVISHSWHVHSEKLRQNPAAVRTYLPKGRAPGAGEIFVQPNLAQTLGAIGEQGRDAFYEGDIADLIIACSESLGGLFTKRDLKDHKSTWVKPISVNYRGYDICECPPNGQGLIALLVLNILEGYDLRSLGHNSAGYLHLLVEAIKLAFADGDRYIADPDFADVPVKGLLSKSYAEKRKALISPDRAISAPTADVPEDGDTVYLATIDSEGNSVSFINSLYNAFGSGVVVEGAGICLQNRGGLFSLEVGHRNVIAPHKRPYHTIIPGMVFKDGKLLYTFGVMGGFQQPQGHVQLLANLIDFGMGVQTALDAPRFRYYPGRGCAFEPGIPSAVIADLKKRGHPIVTLDDPYSQQFGGGQVIMLSLENGAYIAGSDPRKDGCAIGL
jgi:gamma-glutamyltranspeptidase/glutathione hydrolase